MKIKGYKVIRPLDEKGGMSEVFLGRDQQSKQQVVIKLMRLPRSAEHDALFLKRFYREIDIARTVEHPHILKALNDGQVEYKGAQVPFLVYPYIEGGSLQNLLLEEEPWDHWTLAQLVELIVQAAEGLYYLHTLNPPIVHHDVKPGNFLLKMIQGDEEGPQRRVHLWLTDFGTARWQREASYQTQNLIGTPVYMAPEQRQGSLSVMSDQYSLALMARYLFTGYAPEPLSTAQPPEHLIFPEIDDVVARALSTNPHERFPTVLEFAHTLRRAVLHQPGQKGFPDRTTEPEPSSVQSVSDIKPPFAPAEPLPPHVQKEGSEFILKDIPLHPLFSLSSVNKPLPLVPQVNKEPQPIQANPLPRLSLHTVFGKELPAQPSMLTWSPDGTQLACTFYGQEPPLLLTMKGEAEMLRALNAAHLASWSPDGLLLAFSLHEPGHKTSRIVLREKSSARSLLLGAHETPTIDGLDWSSRGELAIWVERRILVYPFSPSSVSLDLPLPLPRMLLSDLPLVYGSLGTLRWSPDGRWLAVGTGDGAVCCWRSGDARPSLAVPTSGGRIYSLAWSVDSTWLAVAFQNRQIRIWHLPELSERTSWEALPWIPQMLTFSPDDQVLTVATRRGLFFGTVTDDSPLAQYPGQLLASWSPAGHLLATLDARCDTTLVILER